MPDADATFREIQRHEADIAHAEAALRRAPCGQPAREQTEALCAAKAALCELSSELHDADASTRCLRASEACSTARGHSLARCATEGGP